MCTEGQGRAEGPTNPRGEEPRGVVGSVSGLPYGTMQGGDRVSFLACTRFWRTSDVAKGSAGGLELRATQAAMPSQLFPAGAQPGLQT